MLPATLRAPPGCLFQGLQRVVPAGTQNLGMSWDLAPGYNQQFANWKPWPMETDANLMIDIDFPIKDDDV